MWQELQTLMRIIIHPTNRLRCRFGAKEVYLMVATLGQRGRKKSFLSCALLLLKQDGLFKLVFHPRLSSIGCG